MTSNNLRIIHKIKENKKAKKKGLLENHAARKKERKKERKNIFLKSMQNEKDVRKILSKNFTKWKEKI